MARPATPETIRRLAVYCPNLIGDTVMATPAFRALRRGYPDARIVGIAKPMVAPTLDGSPFFDDMILYDPRSKLRQYRFLDVVSKLRREKFDAVVLFPNSTRSALVAWATGADIRVGYDRGGRGWLLSHRLEPTRDRDGEFLPMPAVEYYAALARVLGCRLDSLRLELATTPRDETQADEAWQTLRLGDSRRVVCLNTGGAFGPAKNWPVEHFATLARRLVNELDAAVLVVCGPAERESARAIVERSDHPSVVSLADRSLSIGLTKACIRRSALLITTDSGPRHFGTAFGIPVVGLFGPTHIAWTRTNHPHALHLQKRLPCGPCQRPTCSEGHHRCMTELTPDRVFGAARQLLDGRASSPLMSLGPITASVES